MRPGGKVHRNTVKLKKWPIYPPAGSGCAAKFLQTPTTVYRPHLNYQLEGTRMLSIGMEYHKQDRLGGLGMHLSDMLGIAIY